MLIARTYPGIFGKPSVAFNNTFHAMIRATLGNTMPSVMIGTGPTELRFVGKFSTNVKRWQRWERFFWQIPHHPWMARPTQPVSGSSVELGSFRAPVSGAVALVVLFSTASDAPLTSGVSCDRMLFGPCYQENKKRFSVMLAGASLSFSLQKLF